MTKLELLQDVLAKVKSDLIHPGTGYMIKINDYRSSSFFTAVSNELECSVCARGAIILDYLENNKDRINEFTKEPDSGQFHKAESELVAKGLITYSELVLLEALYERMMFSWTRENLSLDDTINLRNFIEEIDEYYQNELRNMNYGNYVSVYDNYLRNEDDNSPAKYRLIDLLETFILIVKNKGTATVEDFINNYRFQSGLEFENFVRIYG